MNALNCLQRFGRPAILPGLFLLGAVLCLHAPQATAETEVGFTPLFDGKTLDGWTYIGNKGGEYFVSNSVIVCPSNSWGNLITEREYADFTLRLEYKLEPGGNNGVAIRVPATKENLTYVGVEIQMLDDHDPQYAHLHDWQYNGSVYGIVPARDGAPKIGEWNTEEITCIGRHYHIVLNDKVIVDTDLNDVHDAEVLQAHPGMLRDRGHVGFLGHNSLFLFRNIRIKELPVAEQDNVAPKGFVALFNGSDLSGWQGTTNESPGEHWSVKNGELRFDGQGHNLWSTRDYGNFELLADLQIAAGEGSGIALPGGSQMLPGPERVRPAGEWNHLRIVLLGDRAHVFLNGDLMANNIPVKNIYENAPSVRRLGLQTHGAPLSFKNLYLRELSPPK